MINYEKNGNSAYVLPFGTDYQEYLKPLQKKSVITVIIKLLCIAFLFYKMN